MEEPFRMNCSIVARLGALCLAAWIGVSAAAEPAAAPTAAVPRPKVMLLGLFHFDNPGLDAVKYTPRDVMQPPEQAYLVALAERLARFAPTKVLLEYPAESDAAVNARYARYLAGGHALQRNEIEQIGFRVARLAGLGRVDGFDVDAPPFEEALWTYLPKEPAAEAALEQLISAESARLDALHRSRSLGEILAIGNSAAEDRRNRGFYLLLNPVGARQRLFHGADAAAHWWHRNFRMAALIQAHAAPGERVLVIAGSGHTAVLRELLRSDADRDEEDVLPYL